MNLYLKEQSLLLRARRQGPRKREAILREAVKVKLRILKAECSKKFLGLPAPTEPHLPSALEQQSK
jgi:hypothetical protein